MNTTSAVPAAAQKAVKAFARGGEHVSPDALDACLAEIADQAAFSLLRDRYRSGAAHAAYHELLSTVAALRAVLGFSQTPTAREVMEWQDRQRTVYADAVQGRKTQYPVLFVNGPYRGVEMRLGGPAEAYPKADDPLGHLVGDGGWIAGPPAYVTLPIAWGDAARPGYGAARYKRGQGPDAEGLWPFRLCADYVPLRNARPHITVPATWGN